MIFRRMRYILFSMQLCGACGDVLLAYVPKFRYYQQYGYKPGSVPLVLYRRIPVMESCMTVGVPPLAQTRAP
jgi:hypothetical protein